MQVVRSYRWKRAPWVRPAARVAAGKPRDLLQFVAPLAREERVEVLWLFPLDRQGRLVLDGPVEIARGEPSEVVVPFTEVLLPVLALRAPGFALAHNHPTASSAPSHMDLVNTKAVAALARALGIRLWDHVIYAPRSAALFSFKQQGLL